jgi:hypothetical protein
VTSDSGTEPRRKHRHDLGHEDHGPEVASGPTRAIQSLLAVWITATVVLVGWALLEGGRGTRAPAAPPASTTGR